MQILLIEDDELFRLGLTIRLQQEADWQVAAAADGEQAIELARQQCFDVALLDIGLPSLGGVETCRQLVQIQPALPVLVLTSRAEPDAIARLVAAGARGYCRKGISAETLILAMRSIAAGASWWDDLATSQIQAAMAQSGASSLPKTVTSRGDRLATGAIEELTQREQEILNLIAQGQSNQDIAQTLHIAPGTVRVHVHAILQKLGVRDRTQAVVHLLQHQAPMGDRAIS
ncbi:response regulator transcription factor [Limnothrix sp. FACHB-1083]|uniref:response regulator n=1 Tax=unclassified Limnothrix TaxID=2632864 RepID=UPI0016803E5E|nr:MULTISPECIES: response regulator transcription factor [unclassified Limnothrix]MBD2160347.1 response regulator transcription factor [Limnothrix sp. FACHB-1083]MBD2191048.1 response regulator transcription factor [Limnothrix sp. FACHB-1088]